MYTYDQLGNPVLPEPTAAELDTLAAQLALLDPEKEGVTMNRLRAFYPTEGWDIIGKRLAALVAQNRARSWMSGSPVPFQYFALV